MGNSNKRSSTNVAAIDAGSNGMRLAIGRVDEDGKLRELETIRAPVRLGADTFSVGQFSDATMDGAVAAFGHFAGRIKANDVEHVRAVATSATRDSANGPALVARIAAATGIRLEIIDGVEEAHLVFSGVAAAVDLSGRAALLVDMGGGSVEVTVARGAVALGCEALSLGCVRLLSRLEAEGKVEADLEAFLAPFRGSVASLVRAELKDAPIGICVGTGGNLECLGRLRVPMLGKSKAGKVKVGDLDKMIEILLGLTPAERASQFELRPDRADVIAIAAMVLRMILRDAGVAKMVTPPVGLAQGLLLELAERVTAGD
jgi:exopolyphosphatase / guanosine-5'-triphosphate,3'-diphosphate pyrophosphatase